jgi:hypothetical protein
MILKTIFQQALMFSGRIFGFAVVFFIFLVTIYYLYTKKIVPIRPLPQVEAMREGVGRCAEMGKPLLFNYGNPTQGMDYWTVAGLNLLRFTAEIAAPAGVKLIIPLSATPKSLITHAVVKDIVKNVCEAAGTPELYNEANFRLTGTDDPTWALAVYRIMYETNPGAHYFLGFQVGYNVLFGEAGSDLGCLSIGSSFYMAQIAFSVITSDYTFINQDLVAASAYVSKDPAQGGFLRAIDSNTFLMIFLIVIGSILMTVGNNFVQWIMGV